MCKFTKMHGIGNDYVYFDCTKEDIENPQELSIELSDRHFGVGSDGIILIRHSDIADFKMSMFNADGSEGKMCGNGIRCVGKFAYDKGLTDKTKLEIETLDGIKYLNLAVKDGKVQTVTVNMGKAVLKGKEIPTTFDMDKVVDAQLVVEGVPHQVTCVSMGNPHCVLFVDEEINLLDLNLEKIGPGFENHAVFPDRVNTEFIKVIDDKTLEMRVWERGSGETWACGTGACASVVAAVLNGFCKHNEEITVKLRGGDLKIKYMEDGTVFMEGSATTVFEGYLE